MKLQLNISPCPNDTFMFDGMINGRVDLRGLHIVPSFYDIEQLNSLALEGSPLISKVSCAVLPQLVSDYVVLNSGSALGNGNGPLIVAKDTDAVLGEHTRLAIPGRFTTANMLSEIFYPDVQCKTEVLFSEIAQRVASGEFDAGILIHEGRFTYRNAGLSLIADLGKEWEVRTSMPLPLGAIIASRTLPQDTIRSIDAVLRSSIEYAFAHPHASMEFVRKHAREMDQRVIKDHIALFVNDYSLRLGSNGKDAVRLLAGLAGRDIFIGDDE